MKWNEIMLAGALAAIAGSSYAQSMDPLQLRSLAASCSNCHGTLGVAEAGNESLAGANKDDMLKIMMDFKTGKKPATIMHQLSKGYTDEQLAALASYFSSLKK
jgi:sulfide dehydrogenase cytochrome subunit